jgi:DNA (cytosine-5)-methyltransferase 1
MVTLNPVFAKWHERTYVMTYSFPCQSLSLAGKMDGMEEGSGTQSSLLWEVGRLLQSAKEHDVLPDILLMENVPEVIGERNVGVFRKWLELLHSLGYRSKWQILNAADFKVPQNRRRCFMVSWRSDDYYDFPDPMPLEHRLKDLLEKNVPERYYLTDKQIRYVKSPKRLGHHTRISDGDCIAKTRTAKAGNNWTGDFISCKQAGTLHGGMYEKTIEQSKRVWGVAGLSPTIHTQSSGGSEIKIECQERVRCLTELECFRLQGVKREDFERLKVRQSSSSLYHMAGDSIETTCLMAIFGKMFEGLDYEKKIDEVVEDITHD